MAQLSVRDYVLQLVHHEVLRPLALLEVEDDDTTSIAMSTTAPMAAYYYGNDDVCSTPSTVCSVISTNTVTPAQKPLCLVLDGDATATTPADQRVTFDGHARTHTDDMGLHPLQLDVPHAVVRGILDAMAVMQHTANPSVSTPTKAAPRIPSSRVVQALTADLGSIVSKLLAQGYTTEGELLIALALIHKATTPSSSTAVCHDANSDKKCGTLRVTNANARRVIISAIRLAAKCHSDEYFTIKDICQVASLSPTQDFHRLVAECEWKMFLALDMDCAVSIELLEAVQQRALKNQQEGH